MLQVTFVILILLLASCGFDQKPDSKDVAEEQNDERIDNDKKENDAQFLVNAAEIHMKQIKLGQLAQQNGKTKHVRELGKMMEDAHTKSINELRALAKRKMISIPTSSTNDAQDAYKDLKEKSIDDFDKAYADMMVSEHKDAIETFEEASTDCNDTDIKNWATATLPGLRAHLDRSIDSQNKFDTMYLEKNK